jgi:hypothetical protein
VEELSCSAVGEGGRHGGRNGRCGAAKLEIGAAPITEEREWGGGTGWWPRGGKDGGGIGSATRGATVEEGPSR